MHTKWPRPNILRKVSILLWLVHCSWSMAVSSQQIPHRDFFREVTSLLDLKPLSPICGVVTIALFAYYAKSEVHSRLFAERDDPRIGVRLLRITVGAAGFLTVVVGAAGFLTMATRFDLVGLLRKRDSHKVLKETVNALATRYWHSYFNDRDGHCVAHLLGVPYSIVHSLYYASSNCDEFLLLVAGANPDIFK
jgi:hypothetical protein